jgi:hypothetical protein
MGVIVPRSLVHAPLAASAFDAGPVSDTPCYRAWATSSSASCWSAIRFSVAVITPPLPPGCQARRGRGRKRR